MEKQTLLNEIKDFAKGIVTKYFPEKEKFSKNAKLADGTLISYDAEQLATGVVAYVVDTTGKEMPMPKGSYVLEDGTTFDVVDDMGTVDNVVAAPEQPEPADAPMMPQATPAAPTAQSAAPQAAPKAIVESTVKETRFSKEELELEREVYEEKFNKAIEKVEAEKLEFAKQVDELKAKAEKNEVLITEMFELIKKIAEYEGKKPEVAATETRSNTFNIKEWRQAFKEDLNKHLK